MQMLLAIVLSLAFAAPGFTQTRTHSTGALRRQEALVHYRLGWENMRHEAWDDAVTAFSKATDIDPEYELAFYGLGQAYMPLKRYVQAIAAYTRCKDLYGARSGRQFASAQDAQRYRQDRLTDIDELIRQVRSGPMTQQMMERLRQLEDQRRQLQENIQRGFNMTIENTVPAFVLLALGSAYFRAEKFPDAEREYLDALEIQPDFGEAHNNLAVVYLYTNRPADAEKHVKLAEKAGFRVNPELKDSIKQANKKIG